jgi:NAD+ synthase (glutamine-hydrolysing)
MRIALGQINTTVGDLVGNASLMMRYARRAAEGGAEAIVFPELALTGYPPQDLLERPAFLEAAETELQRLAVEAAPLRIAIICGTAEPADFNEGKRVWNTAAMLHRGKVVFRQHKMLLPTYDVFDEQRYFRAAESQSLACLGSTPVAITICEDAWNDQHFWEKRLYARDPVEELIGAGAKAILSINASPYHIGKRALREQIFTAAARRHQLPLVYVNQVGGNDQLVFDGSSFAMDATGKVIAAASSFAEELVFANFHTGTGDLRASHPEEIDAVYEALVLGTRDYFRKTGFRKALLGLSGGIDSALVACIAVEALGKENVTGVAMPGPYSSDHSLTDAIALANALGIHCPTISINNAYAAMIDTLQPAFAGAKPDVTEENLQSRLRGMTLMALSNKTGALVLTTGNKSESAVGYATLYGDMCGGLAVISDVAKMQVYALCRVANRRLGNAIPESVFVKPPSAELRPDQKDSDSLPEYPVLDAILELYVEQMVAPARIAEKLNLPLALVSDVARKVDRNEYKRQQAAPGLKVTTKAFGFGRRLPIAQGYIE